VALQEIRADPSVPEHRYLLMGDVSNYQNCFDNECFAALRRHSADSSKYINIWIYGYNRLPSPAVPVVSLRSAGRGGSVHGSGPLVAMSAMLLLAWQWMAAGTQEVALLLTSG
jgi:hypothetical protein